MREIPGAWSCGVVLAALLVVAGGCYEEQPPPAQAGQAQAQPAGPTGGSQPSGGNAYGGAKRAAQRTVDKVQQRQQEVEKAVEDQE